MGTPQAPISYDRLAEMDRMWGKLDTDNILLLAPRRVGKTSLMKQMAQNAGKYGFRPLFVDVADCANELRFVERIYTSILTLEPTGKLRQTILDSDLGKMMQSISKVGGWGLTIESKTTIPDWEVLGEEFARVIGKLPGKWCCRLTNCR